MPVAEPSTMSPRVSIRSPVSVGALRGEPATPEARRPPLARPTASPCRVAPGRVQRPSPAAPSSVGLRARPELAGQAAIRGEVTEDSAREQGGSGLLDCSPGEFARSRELNQAHAEKFGSPFIIAVRGLDRAAIIEAFARRLGNGPEAEMAEAPRQIARIAGHRSTGTVEETRPGLAGWSGSRWTAAA